MTTVWSKAALLIITAAIIYTALIHRYTITGDGISAYKLDRLTGRVWWLVRGDRPVLLP